MKSNPLRELTHLGQSIWLDLIRRGMFVSHELQELIVEDDLRGVTSNPAIFEKAISGSHDYDTAIRVLALEGKDANAIYQALTVEDVQAAADLFKPVYERTKGRDGFVSLEVSPKLARDTNATISEAQYLWQKLDRPNVMIKVPGTAEGIPAIRELTALGLNVNVTLLFGLPRYREVVDAYLAGLEMRLKSGKPIDHISSVASFFLSRIDVLVDPMLEAVMKEGTERAKSAATLHGETAIYCAKVAYQIYKEVFGGSRFKSLQEHGAQFQRLLWASTSTKNPSYPDVKYVEALIGPNTINTMPLETLHAYRDHGHPKLRLEDESTEAKNRLKNLGKLGIDLEKVTARLEEEGIEKFVTPFDKLLSQLDKKRETTLGKPVDRLVLQLGSEECHVSTCLERLGEERFVKRIWRKDASLWKQDPATKRQIQNSLGWLDVSEKMEAHLLSLRTFAAEVLQAGFRHVLHMGMGGSSLAALVFEKTFGRQAPGIPVTVLDTTDPATIKEFEKQLPLENTLFIVATKSGTTTEPLAFANYFFEKVRERKGERAGDNFVAITDPNSPLVAQASKRNFRRIFLNFTDIGGRYSTLSFFGLVPATLMGIDPGELIARAERMKHANSTCVAAKECPALILGVVMGELARQGRDKVTFLVDNSIQKLGLWLEQLLAESTGKEGTGLIPIANEPLGDASVYGADRVFIHIGLDSSKEDSVSSQLTDIHNAGHPVVRIRMEDLFDVGQEFFRWEFATASSGAILGINPFDQPNVQESKDNTNQILTGIRKKGRLLDETPSFEEGPLSFFGAERGDTGVAAMARFLSQVKPGDYLALMAYLTEDERTTSLLQSLRTRLRDNLKIATTLGYGPRFLHSTGQIHKGGPNTGLFLQLTTDEAADLPIPGEPCTFGTLRRAQALGDFEALKKHGRRVLRVHIHGGIAEGLGLLAEDTNLALRKRRS